MYLYCKKIEIFFIYLTHKKKIFLSVPLDRRCKILGGCTYKQSNFYQSLQ